jgi:chromate transporter
VYRHALPGLNSAAVGLIVASVFQLTFSALDVSPHPITSVCVGILAYGATDVLAVPAPIVVLGGGVIGVIAWAADMK